MSYAELHALSNFSFLRGASHTQELVQRAHELGYSALALTDECSLAGVVRAHEKAKELGLKLIIGSEFRLECGLKLVLLAPDHAAYSELCQLITLGRRRAKKGSYRLTRTDIEQTVRNCLALWVPAGEVKEGEAQWLQEYFSGRTWIAVHRLLEAGETERLQRLAAFSRRYGLPQVAAGDVHYHLRQRRYLQDVLTAVRLGRPVSACGRALFANGERHLRPLATLQKLYPAALLEETLAIAERCRFSLSTLRYQYPSELVPIGVTAAAYLRQRVEEGSRGRWPQGTPAEVQATIEKELALIAELGYEHYFLTIEDLVRYARSQNILCQGRGSAANSVVCYALGITEVNPEQIKMLFERFVSKERSEPPDIDIDFEHQRREEVIQYVYRKYGRERAAIAATVITYRPRSAIRDVGKALGLSLDQVDALAKAMYWFDRPGELAERLRELGFDPQSRRLRQMIQLVNTIIRFPRHLSQHVGGFVISEQPLATLVPVENAAMPERTIIQWDKEDLETLGLLKVDVLALGMLSVIRRALDFVAQRKNRPFAMADIPQNDKATYEMIGRGETIGVFQIESRAQMSMLPRLKPEKFYDLVIEIAIVRPGPIQGGMVHPYLKRRQGLEPVSYPNQDLEAVLGRTLGVPLFQEQVMQIAMVAAGFSPGEADQVRRSMAAWQRKGGLEHLRERLLGGMAQRGYTPEFAEQIYQQILGFGSYGFPESHSASFALLAYASAWLKRHEPAAFLAALLNSQPMGFYQPAQLVNEAKRAGVAVRPVDVLISDWDCMLEPSHSEHPAVRLGLRMVGGLPEVEARRIAAVCRTRSIRCVDELAYAADIPTRSLQVLADGGALQSLAGHRHASRWAASGVEYLPGMLAQASASEPLPALTAPSEGEDILDDYRSLGLTLGRHPLALLRSRLQNRRCLSAAALAQQRSGQFVRVAGIVTHRQRPETASGVLFMTLEDETGYAQIIVWPRVLDAQRQVVLGSSLMLVQGQLQIEQSVIHVVARKIENLSIWLGRLPSISRDFR
ncbi:MAG: error-prone DNA polymerase [Nevskiales bacterium]